MMHEFPRSAARQSQPRTCAAAARAHNERNARCYPRCSIPRKIYILPPLLHCGPLSGKKPKFPQTLRSFIEQRSHLPTVYTVCTHALPTRAALVLAGASMTQGRFAKGYDQRRKNPLCAHELPCSAARRSPPRTCAAAAPHASNCEHPPPHNERNARCYPCNAARRHYTPASPILRL